MLIDLTFSRDYAEKSKSLRMEFLREVSTENGGLSTTWELPSGEKFEQTNAVRIQKGIYSGFSFEHTVKTWTKWDVENVYVTGRELFTKLETAGNEEEKRQRQADFNKWLSIPSFGIADNLQQVFRRCRHYVQMPEPCVVALRLLTQKTDGGMRWHKQGDYIGKHKNRGEYFHDTPEIDNLVFFEWMLLKSPMIKD